MLIQGVTFAIEVAITGEQATSQNTQSYCSGDFGKSFIYFGNYYRWSDYGRIRLSLCIYPFNPAFTNFWIAATVSSAIFSLAHTPMVTFFVLFLYGIFLLLFCTSKLEKFGPQLLPIVA